MKKILCIMLSIVMVLGSLSMVNFAVAPSGGQLLYENGFIKGSSNTEMVLNEQKDFTREQLAVIILEISGKKAEAAKAALKPNFIDNDSMTWSAPYVAYCVKEGLMSGSPVEGSDLNKFNPKGIVSGKQLATVLYRALGYKADWNTVMDDVSKLGLSVENKKLTRGDAFDFIWDSITKPVCKDGGILAVKLGKMTKKDVEDIRGIALNPNNNDNTATQNAFAGENNLVLKIEKDGKYGLMDVHGNILVKPMYDSIDDFKNGLAKVTQSGMSGFINAKGEVVIPVAYGKCAYMDGTGLIKVEQYGKYGAFNTFGKQVIPCEYVMVTRLTDKVIKVNLGGVLNGSGRAIRGKNGAYNTSGTLIMPVEFGNIWKNYAEYNGKVMDDRFLVLKDGLQGMISDTGEEIIPNIYNNIGIYGDSKLLGVDVDGKAGFVDCITGEVAIPLIYDRVGDFREGHAAVEKDGKHGYIDETGNVVIDIKYDQASPFKEGIARVELDGKEQYIDKNGEVVFTIDDGYSVDGFTRDHRIPVRKSDGGKIGYIDTNGRWITDCKYYGANDFDNGLAVVSIQDETDDREKYGVINTNGEEIIELIYSFFNSDYDYYDYMMFERNGKRSDFAFLSKDNKNGCFDKNGKIVVPAKYRKIDILESDDYNQKGFIVEDASGHYGLIAANGDVLLKAEYDQIDVSSDFMSTARKGSTVEFFNNKGNKLFGKTYQKGSKFAGGYAGIQENGMFYVINSKGEKVMRSEYFVEPMHISK